MCAFKACGKDFVKTAVYAPRLAVVSTIFVKTGNERVLSLEYNGLLLQMIIVSQTI